MRLPIGYDDFRKVIDNKLDFVDKTLFAKDVIDDTAEVILITRPRRFGKTFNLSMLRYFFADKVNGQSTQELFDGLKIAQSGAQYMQHQGQHPAIFLTFKDVKETSFDAAYASICKLMSQIYLEHEELLESPNLTSQQKIIYKKVMEEQAAEVDIRSALKDLTHYLYRHHGKKPVVLIDEYDAPIQSGYLHGYYPKIVSFMQSLLGAALKTNSYLHKAVLTGILRISKESLFSGLNNLKVYSLLNKRYAKYFGFTETEVEQLLIKAKLQQLHDEIKKWYNGYQIGEETVYNPWSIVNCLQEEGSLKPYWVNTSDNALIKNLLVQTSGEFKKQFELLLQKKPIEKIIDENFVFDDMVKDESAAWSLLLMAGYLKVTDSLQTDQGLRCVLEIPNREINNLYRGIIERWLSNGYGVEWYNRFLQHLLEGNVIAFEEALTHILQQTISVHDTAKQPEAFYHGLMLGFTASLNQKEYEVKSNHESGYGRYDIVLIPQNKQRLGIILEIKITKEDDLQKTAEQALDQIDKQQYEAELKQRGISHILKIGIAFKGKKLALLYR
jgi:hypothetical protein